MATYAGQILPIEIVDFAKSTAIDQEVELVALIDGGVEKNHVNIFGTSNNTGEIVASSHDIAFRNKLYYSPASIAAGLIGADIAYTITFWNAGKENISLISITSTEASGWQITGAIAPLAIRPETVELWTLTILADGPPTQETTIYFEFSDGSVYPVTITGRRIETFAFPCDAVSSLKVKYQFETVVARSYKYREQRRSLRINPYRTITARFSFFSHEEREKFLNKLFLYQSKIIAVPYYPEEFSISADPQGLSSITFSADEIANRFELLRAAFLVIYNENDSDNAELLVIDSISGATVNLSGTVVGSYDPNCSFVAPAFLAICPQPDGKILSPLVSEFTADFEEYT